MVLETPVVVDPLGSKILLRQPEVLAWKRGSICADIQLGVIGILMKGHQIVGYWQVRIYNNDNMTSGDMEKTKRKWAKDKFYLYCMTLKIKVKHFFA